MKTKRKYKRKSKSNKKRTRRGGFALNRCTLRHLFEDRDSYKKICCDDWRIKRSSNRLYRCAAANQVDKNDTLRLLDFHVKDEIKSQKDGPSEEQNEYILLRGKAFGKTKENRDEVDYESFKNMIS